MRRGLLTSRYRGGWRTDPALLTEAQLWTEAVVHTAHALLLSWTAEEGRCADGRVRAKPRGGVADGPRCGSGHGLDVRNDGAPATARLRTARSAVAASGPRH